MLYEYTLTTYTALVC